MKISIDGGPKPEPEDIKAGEKIANNYKRSLAERLVREAQEAEGADSKSMASVMSPGSKSGKSMNATGMSTRKGENDQMKLISSKL